MDKNNLVNENKNLVLSNKINLTKQKKHKENIIKTAELEGENKSRGFWYKIKSAWNWFYSGKIRSFICRVLELWAKWTFLYNMTDLLMLGTILFTVPFFAQITAIYLSVKMLIFGCFVGTTIINVVNESADKEKAQAYIDKMDREYYAGLDCIYKDSLLSKAGAEFVWQNFRGRIFDILVTSSCLLFIPTRVNFILYCVFVAMSALCFLKDVGIAIYWYLDIRNKHRREKIADLQENFLDANLSHSITQVMTKRRNTLGTSDKKEYPEKAKTIELSHLNSRINDDSEITSMDVMGDKHN